MPDTETIPEGSPLDIAGQALIKAAEEYWRIYNAQRFEGGGAVVWLDDSNGNTVIFTRGEYRPRLLANIEIPGPDRHFHHVTTDAQLEAEFESKTPDGLLG